MAVLFFFFFQEFLFISNHIHPSSLLCNGNFLYWFLFIFTLDFHFIFQKIFRKRLVTFFWHFFFFADIFLWKKFPSHYLLLTPVLPFSSCGFQITLFFFFFLASWTHSMLSSLFILSAFVHFLSFLCFIFRLLLLT